MEIFNNIWTALSTPTNNNNFINLITLPLCLVEAIISVLLFTTILNIKADKRTKLLYIIEIMILSILTKFAIPAPYNIYINIIFTPLAIFFTFRIGILKSIIAAFFPSIINVCLESIIVQIFFVCFKISIDIAYTTPIFRILIMICIYTFLYSLYFMCKKLDFNINILDNLNSKSKTIFIITFILGFLVVCFQYYLTNFYSTILPFFITIMSILVTFAFFFMTIYSLSQVTKLQITTTDLEEAKLYNKTLSMLHDNIRTFKHDFHNIVQGIGGYIHTDDMEGLKKFYSGLSLDCNRSNNLTTLSPSVINNPAIYNVLASKYHKADEFGIQINLEVFIDLNTLNMKIYEFTRILGILMDNAIEATLQCDEKIINIIIRKEDNNNRQILYIENTYKDNGTTVDKLFEKGYSSKEGNTGLGLWEVRQILHKNNNLNLFTDKDKKFFKQQLEIYK